MATVCAEKSKSQVEISVVRAAAISLGYNAEQEQEQALEAFSKVKTSTHHFQRDMDDRK